MKATIELTPIERMVSSATGSAAVGVISGDMYFMGTLRLGRKSRWYLTLTDGEIVPLYDGDLVGLYSTLKVG